MANEYEAIDNLEKSQNNLLDKSMATQNDVINKQTQMNIDTLQRQKDEIDKDANKVNKALYTEYRKASNPYGANAEAMAQRGLGNSGYSETTQTNLYNTYQRNVTDTLNNARQLKSDFDFQMSQARQNGDIAMAQNAIDIYNQKLQLLTQNYELRNNREQFLYQKDIDKRNYDYQVGRDKVADSQWNKTFDYNKYVNDRDYNYRKTVDDRNYKYQKKVDDRNYKYQVGRDKVTDNQWQQKFDYDKYINDRNYNYQVDRDAVSDDQWEREYELSKKASARASSGRSRSSSGGSNGQVAYSSPADDTAKPTAEQVFANLKILQGPGNPGVIDGISGKQFSSVDEIFKYYDL